MFVHYDIVFIWKYVTVTRVSTYYLKMLIRIYTVAVTDTAKYISFF